MNTDENGAYIPEGMVKCPNCKTYYVKGKPHNCPEWLLRINK